MTIAEKYAEKIVGKKQQQLSKAELDQLLSDHALSMQVIIPNLLETVDNNIEKSSKKVAMCPKLAQTGLVKLIKE